MVTDGWPIKWDGTVTGPDTYSASFWSIGLGGAAHFSTLFNLAYGTWSVSAKNPPAPGYTLKGYTVIDSGGFSNCPNDPASYGKPHSFQIDDQHPIRQVCILVEHPPIIAQSSLTLGILSVGAGSNTWDGIVTGPAGYAAPWNKLLIGGPNFMGGQYNLFAGTYSVVPGNPVRPGWVVTGYASYETSNFLQACPSDPAAYKPSPTPVTLSDKHPSWGICLKIEKAPPVVETTPTVVLPPEFTFDWPDLEPTSTPSPTVPAKTATPAPTQTPTSTVTTATTTIVPATATDSPARPVNENAGGSTQNTANAPLPPNTGTGAASTNSNSLFLLLGLLLVGGSGLILAANRLPGRPRR